MPTYHDPVVRALVANTLNSDGNVAIIPSVVPQPNLRSNEPGLLGLLSSEGVGRRREVGKVLLGKSDELVVVDGSGSGEHHLVGVEVGSSVGKQIILRYGLDVLGGSKDIVTEGLS